MKLNKIIHTLGMLTLMSLVYIHMQMRIFDLAYQGKNKEKRIQELQDDNGRNNYHILYLKSANHLGTRMLDEDLHLEFISQDRVQQISTPASGRTAPRSLTLTQADNTPAKAWREFLSLLNPPAAEAQELGLRRK